MAAVPTPATLREDLYDALAGRVVFREGKTGTVNLICPISNPGVGWHLATLNLTYRDGDADTDSSTVSAALRVIRTSDGHVETVENGTVSSNDESAPDSGAEGWATHQSDLLGHTHFDYEENYYYVQITLRREYPDVPLGAIGVSLDL